MKQNLSNSSILWVLLFCFGCIFNVYSQPPLFSYETYTNTKGDTLKYRMLHPDYDTIRKYPLVVFLHGSGERGNDNNAQLKWGVMNFATDQNMKLHPAFVIARNVRLTAVGPTFLKETIAASRFTPHHPNPWCF